MKKTLALILALVMCLCLFAACGSSNEKPADSSKPADTQEEKIIIKLAGTNASVGLEMDGMELYKEIVERLTDGRVQVDLFPNSLLGDKTELMEGCAAGTIEMVHIAASDMTPFVARWSVFSLPYMFESGEDLTALAQDEDFMAMLQADAASAGYRIMDFYDTGARSIFNVKHEVATPADLNGLMIRVINDPVLIESITLMGAIGTTFAWGECYSGLQQGAIDGLEHSPFNIIDSKFYEVGKYYSLTEHFRIPAVAIMSKTFWEGLPADIQEALIAADAEYVEGYAKLLAEANANALTQLEAEGVTITEVDTSVFAAQVEPIYDKYLETAPEGAEELLNFILG